ncbi:metallophosphoesterase family protein [Gluconobacter morbifer]|uniref:metallophosphoesterase n=1 Tax=Gluconobacter morbifer TaxID=479935 RepID=UPI001FDF8D21|nr:metallophosphoesterase [Gluconobacter morbifer]
MAHLHLGKGTFARMRGLLLPPGDTVSTLEKEQRLVEDYKPRLLIALGDSFHGAKAEERLLDTEKAVLRAIASKTSIVRITGNHDIHPVPDIAGEWLDEYHSGNLILHHIPSETVPTGKAELAGHLHPKIRMRIRGHVISSPYCIKGPDRLILPALGFYTDGLDVSDSAFRGLFLMIKASSSIFLPASLTFQNAEKAKWLFGKARRWKP